MEKDEFNSLAFPSKEKSLAKQQKAVIKIFERLCRSNSDDEALKAIPKEYDQFIPPSLQLLSIKPPDCEFGVFVAPADDAASTLIAKLGLFEDLVKTLKTLVQSWNVSFESLASNIAATLMALTVRSSSNQSGIRHLDGISALARLLKLSHNDTTLFWTCASLRNIARHDENMSTLSSLDIFPRLIELIQTKNMALQEASAGALWNIAWGGSIGSQNDTDAIRHVLDLLKSPNDNIVNCGSSILMNLTMGEASAENRKLIIQAGGVEALVAALDKTNPKVQYSVAGAISNVSIDDNLICRLIGELGAIRTKDSKQFILGLPLLHILTRAIRFFVAKLINLVKTNHPNVVDSAAGALWNLMQVGANRKLISESDLSHFISLVSKWKESATVENILGVIDQFATEEHRFLLFTLGALPVIMDAFLTSESSVVLLQCMHILYEISWHPDGFDPIYCNTAFVHKLGNLIKSSPEIDTRSSAMSTLYPAAGMYSTRYTFGLQSLLTLPHISLFLLLDLIEPVLDIIFDQLEAPESAISSVAYELVARLAISTPEKAFTEKSVRIAVTSLHGKQNLHAHNDAIAFLDLIFERTHFMLLPHTLALLDLAISSDYKEVRRFCRHATAKLGHLCPDKFEKIPGIVSKLAQLLQSSSSSSRAAKAAKKLMEALEEAFSLTQLSVEVPPVSKEASMDFLVGNVLYSDMTLLIQDKKIPVHRCILHGRSAYFRALFESGMKEAADRELRVQTEHSVEEWMEFLRFIYTDTCNVTSQNVQALIEMADLYSLARLTGLCEQFLAQTLSEDDIFHVLSLALHARMTQLKDLCRRFVTSHVLSSQRELTDEERDILRMADF